MNTNTQNTPAPWSVSELDARGEPSSYYIFIEPGVAVIEKKVAGHDQCDMSDARLIAAAPDLLEQLQHAVRWFDQITHDDVKRYRAAIAKATGGAT